MSPLERLHDALLDGGLDADQLAELRALLADPAQQRAWWRLTTLAGRLHEELGAVSQPRLPTPRRRPAPRRRAVVRNRWWPVLAAAALLLVVSGWWLARERPVAQLDAGSLAIAGHALRPGDAIRGDLPANADSDGALTLPDGSRCVWTGPVRFVISAGGARLQLDAGDIRIRAAHQAPGKTFTVATVGCETRVVGTYFRVISLPERTCVGVDDGIVSVVTSAGQTQVAAGQATEAKPGELPVARPLNPPPIWRTDLTTGTVPAGWLARAGHGGLVPTASPSDASGDPRRYVNSPAGVPPGLVRFHPGLTFRARIATARAGQVEIFLVCNDPLTGDFRGLLHTRAELSGSGQPEQIAIGVERFVPVTDSDPPVIEASVSSVVLQWWGDDLGSTVSDLALAPQP